MNTTARTASSPTWRERQSFCEDWYSSLPQTSLLTELRREYEPHRAALAKLRGLILDVGGGCGFSKHYVDPKSRLITLDPSASWTEQRWAELAPHRLFLRGCGESLPFQSNLFNAAISMWSLNHAQDPRRMVLEMVRVLCPLGRLMFVLEEPEPRWIDLLDIRFLRQGVRAVVRQTLWRKVLGPLVGETTFVQLDHMEIAEDEVLAWAESCVLTRREWVVDCLVLEFVKTATEAGTTELITERPSISRH